MALGTNPFLWGELEDRERALAQGSRHGFGSPFEPRRYDSLGRILSSGGPSRFPWGDGQYSRVERVRMALSQSGPQAMSLLRQQFDGVDIDAIAHALLDVAQEVALVYGSAVALGAGIGGALGGLAGGVGAVPGALAGGSLGAQAAGAALALMGLQALLEHMSLSMPEALRWYEQGFTQAWGPVPTFEQNAMPRGHGGSIYVAAHNFAQGHVILATAVLTALAAYLLRGAGNKALVLRDIRASPRLGPRVADWLEQHGDALVRHVQHPPQRHAAAGGGGRKPPAEPPPRRGSGGEEPAPKRRMGQHRVRCFDGDKLPAGKHAEFDRQLAGQQDGLNKLSVDEYVKGREAFSAGDVSRNPAVARQAREEYASKLSKDISKQLQTEGMPPAQADASALAQAAQKMQALAALHTPDLVAGGKDTIGGFGDRQVNSSIGPQWKRSGTLMNAKLERCK